ncbi:MAG: threonine--tRNA ligase [Candidatus Aenigmarchaeota archaeon]|nr:threonine--tRNA ligase [Candidatus Aenigmarchaeota archaeon]
MKLLLIHSDFLEFEPKEKAIKDAPDIEKELKRVDDCLVVFTSVEKCDEKDPKQIVSNSIAEIQKIANQVKTKKIVIYPWVHLTSEPATPTHAIKILEEMKNGLKPSYSIYLSPFGWYKSFTIKCKGHPLSELSRDIKADKVEVSTALKKEEKLKSNWFILEPNGTMNKIEIKDGKIEGFNFSEQKKLKKLAKYEMKKSRVVKKEPPHIKLMKKLELVDYEPGSDPGNLRYYPKGKMIKALIEEWVTQKTLEYGAMEVESPIMYDYEHPSLKKYLHRFPARQYTIQTPNKKVFLRFAACFGQFLMMHDANVSYRDLPVRLYEITKYSFRVEQRGELAGLRRLRAFTMPDCHAFCKDIEQAKGEMIKRFELADKIQSGVGLGREDFELAIRTVKSFWDENKDYIIALVKKWGKPALVEIWDSQFFYFVLKYEWNFIDALDKAACLTTDQIDVENGERYDLRFTDADNKQKHPIILHLSPSGAVERVMYALLERAYMEQKNGENPVLPLWLSPTQVRLCPVSDEFTDYAKEIANKIEKKIRVDVDDRAESVQKKIRDAEMEWIPYIVVIGEKEKKSGKLAVRFRETGKVENMKEDELIKFIREQIKDKPYRPLPLPKLLSKRPVFRG